MKMQIKETVTVGIPFYQIEKEVAGIGWVGDSRSFDTRTEAEAALAARLPAAPKAAKLSPKMKEVMDQLLNAKYYYLVDHLETHKTLDTLHTVEGKVGNLSQRAHRIEGDRILLRNNTSTLLALANRGLVEVLKDGGSYDYDIVRLIGVEAAAAPLTSVIEVKVTKSYDYNGKMLTQKFIEWATPDAVDLVAEHHKWPGQTITVEVLGEVTISLWDPKN